MNIVQFVDNMSKEIYLRLKHAAETGKWPEGTPISKEQQSSAMQLAMAYQSRHLGSDDMATLSAEGELNHANKAKLKAELNSELMPELNPKKNIGDIELVITND